MSLPTTGTTFVNMEDLERLIQNIEYDNKQYVSLIEKESRMIETLETGISNCKAEIGAKQEKINELDIETKRTYDQFTLNKENLQRVKKTSEVLSEHEEALTLQVKNLQDIMLKEKVNKEKTLNNYKNIWEDYLKKYESFPLAIQLKREEEQVKQKEQELHKLQEKLDAMNKQMEDLKFEESLKDMNTFVIRLAETKTKTKKIYDEINRINLEKQKQESHLGQIMETCANPLESHEIMPSSGNEVVNVEEIQLAMETEPSPEQCISEESVLVSMASGAEMSAEQMQEPAATLTEDISLSLQPMAYKKGFPQTMSPDLQSRTQDTSQESFHGQQLHLQDQYYQEQQHLLHTQQYPQSGQQQHHLPGQQQHHLQGQHQHFPGQQQHHLPGQHQHLPGQQQHHLPGQQQHHLPGQQHHHLPGQQQHHLPGQLQHHLSGQQQQHLLGQQQQHHLPGQRQQQQTLPDKQQQQLLGQQQQTLPEEQQHKQDQQHDSYGQKEFEVIMQEKKKTENVTSLPLPKLLKTPQTPRTPMYQSPATPNYYSLFKPQQLGPQTPYKGIKTPIIETVRPKTPGTPIVPNSGQVPYQGNKTFVSYAAMSHSVPSSTAGVAGLGKQREERQLLSNEEGQCMTPNGDVSNSQLTSSVTTLSSSKFMPSKAYLEEMNKPGKQLDKKGEHQEAKKLQDATKSSSLSKSPFDMEKHRERVKRLTKSPNSPGIPPFLSRPMFSIQGSSLETSNKDERSRDFAIALGQQEDVNSPFSFSNNQTTQRTETSAGSTLMNLMKTPGRDSGINLFGDSGDDTSSPKSGFMFSPFGADREVGKNVLGMGCEPQPSGRSMLMSLFGGGPSDTTKDQDEQETSFSFNFNSSSAQDSPVSSGFKLF